MTGKPAQRDEIRESGLDPLASFMLCAEKGEVMSARIILAMYPEALDIVTVPGGWTPMHVAIEHGQKKFVDFLIESGFDVSTASTGEDPLAPLILALAREHWDIAATLIDKGADLSAFTPKVGATPLMYAAAKGQVGLMEKMLSRGAGVDARDAEGLTPLIYAASEQQADSAKFLLSRGANIDAKTNAGHDAVAYAESRGRPDIAQAILDEREQRRTRAANAMADDMRKGLDKPVAVKPPAPYRKNH